MISQVAAAIERHSASTKEREMVGCFFDFQETSHHPLNKQKPVIECLVSVQVAQLASAKDFA